MANYIQLYLNAVAGDQSGSLVTKGTNVNPITTSPLRTDTESISNPISVGVRIVDPSGSANYTTSASTYISPGIIDTLTGNASAGATVLNITYPGWYSGKTSAGYSLLIKFDTLSAAYTVTGVDTSASTIVVSPGLSAAVVISANQIKQVNYDCWSFRKTSADSWGAWGDGLVYSAGVVTYTNNVFQVRARSKVGEALVPDYSVSISTRCSSIVSV